jgi:DNA modification methylase
VNWRERATLHHGDYRETLALADGKADLVLTSPPYCDARTYGMGCSWTMDDYAALGDAVFAALRPGGHALINVDAPVREWRPGFGTERGFHPWRLMLDWAERVGFRVPDRLAFGRQGIPGEYGGRFRNDWEPLLWLQRPGGEGWLDRWALAEKGAEGPYAGHGARSATADGWYERDFTGRAAEEGVKHRGTLWQFGSVGNGHTGATDIEAQGHTARWPYRLAEDIVRCFCPPDGLACDPFVGAGTSAAAALEHGRRFVGGDLGSRTADAERGLRSSSTRAVTSTQGAPSRQTRLFGGAA